jgi:hypothetical protein
MHEKGAIYEIHAKLLVDEYCPYIFCDESMCKICIPFPAVATA